MQAVIDQLIGLSFFLVPIAVVAAVCLYNRRQEQAKQRAEEQRERNRCLAAAWEEIAAIERSLGVHIPTPVEIERRQQAKAEETAAALADLEWQARKRHRAEDAAWTVQDDIKRTAKRSGARMGAPAGVDLSVMASRATYVALLRAAPYETTTVATMTELRVGGYNRQPVTWSPFVRQGSTRDGRAIHVAHNTTMVRFGPFKEAPVWISHCALVTTPFGGDGQLLGAWAVGYDLPRVVYAKERLQFPPGALTIYADDAAAQHPAIHTREPL